MRPFIKAVSLRDELRATGWVLEIPAVAHLLRRGRLDLSHPVTVITGDNGVGKSTLLEGIARGYGFSTQGGAYRIETAGYPDPLFDVLWVQATTRPKQGYFLRADTHFDYATELGPDGPSARNLHHMSHGESVLAVVEAFVRDGVYLLDEPESGLSAVRQMALLAMLHRLADKGAQFIIVTHSPILLAIPGAHIIEITREGINEGVEVEATTAFRAMRDWLANPAGVADFMVEVTDS
ncbi:AAA family ATPase [Corynebacterium qintianiae]|uniref:AAA family ATPase n=1 Tax=Corynebacterium qintianiae TaxID=2709392 RepID=UPI0013EBAEA0|nr:AAA family ATPase [Corynebacterium qintianiae]